MKSPAKQVHLDAASASTTGEILDTHDCVAPLDVASVVKMHSPLNRHVIRTEISVHTEIETPQSSASL